MRSASPFGHVKLNRLLRHGAAVTVCWAALSLLIPGAMLADEQQQPAEPTAKSHPPAAPYVMPTYRQSYFKLDENGSLEKRDRLPYREEKTYRFRRTIHPLKTAVVVMDPWVDMSSEHLNQYYGKIADKRVVPLVRHAVKLGHPIIVLTNSPEKVEYNTKIHPALAELQQQGKIQVLYHQDLDDHQFAEHLRSRGIDSLIYTGFASNMCVIGRRMGMIPLVHHGFRLFFIPEASAAVEYPDTWQDQSIHRSTTRIISQWIAEIMQYSDFMERAAPSSPAPESPRTSAAR